MKWTRWLSRLVSCSALTLASPLGAQGLDPPPKAAADPPPGAASDAPPAAAPGAPEQPLSTPPEWAEPPEDDDSAAPSDDPSADSEPSEQRSPEERERSLSESSGMLGATGLMRVLSADSGGAGTFRFSLLTGVYSGSGFLCPQCPNNGQGATLQDDTHRVSANLFLSASLTDYLEAYAGIFSHSTSTTRPVEQLKQVVGDWDLGVKVFTPSEKGQIFSAGGALDLGFSTGSGQVGISGIDSINMGIRALGTADFSRRAEDPFPLRAHLNLAYYFDNSANLVKEYEEAQQRTVDRIERFSLDINRVDFLEFGLGVEGMFQTARPFLEWTIDIPANRQGYTCQRDQALGDSCLRDAAQFSTTPSRLTAGVRVLPWQAASWWPEGMSINAALDIATGASSDFLVEVAPEAPWTVWFGVAFAADTQPRVEIQQVATAAPVVAPPDLSVHGLVIEKDTTNAIADALIHFDGRDLTGLITTTEGRFVTGPLDPGRYTFRIAAPGYKEGTCSVDVSESSVPPLPPAAPAGSPAAGSPVTGSPATGSPAAVSPVASTGLASSPTTAEALPGVTPVTCELEPTPKVSNINGRVTDNTSGEAIGTATVRITDVLGRELELQVDEVGAFRFENVPPGATVITVQAAGYLKSVTRLGVEPLQELDQRFSLAPVPTKAGMRIANKQIELVTPIAFAEASAKLSREALLVVQELAPFIEAHPEIGRIEIQGHTADAGPSGMTISTDRANAVRDALVLHGVAAARLTARGYGGGEPLVAADSETARRKNERIVFKLEGSGGAAVPALPPPLKP